MSHGLEVYDSTGRLVMDSASNWAFSEGVTYTKTYTADNSFFFWTVPEYDGSSRYIQTVQQQTGKISDGIAGTYYHQINQIGKTVYTGAADNFKFLHWPRDLSATANRYVYVKVFS